MRSQMVEQLFKLKERDGISDGALARRLGVSWATVSRLKSGERRIGPDVQAAILRQYPELLGCLLVDNGSDQCARPEREPVATGPPPMPQS